MHQVFESTDCFKMSEKSKNIERRKNATPGTMNSGNTLQLNREAKTDESTSCEKRNQTADIQSTSRSDVCHCLPNNVYPEHKASPLCAGGMRNGNVNYTKQSCGGFNMKINVPAFFKLALFVLLLDKLTVSATPLLQRMTAQNDWPAVYANLPRRMFASNDLRIQETEDNSMSKDLEDFISRLTQQATRNRRSAPQCDKVKRNLLSLLQHAIETANNAYRSPRKRHAPMRIVSRSWGSFCQYVHDRLKSTYCLVHNHPWLFRESTDGILGTIDTMILLLQQDMNIIASTDSSFSYHHFDKSRLTCPLSNLSDREAESLVKEELFSVADLLRRACL
ncbi:uncharacterized protein LOC100186650 [Ciona intestinalis]